MKEYYKSEIQKLTIDTNMKMQSECWLNLGKKLKKKTNSYQKTKWQSNQGREDMIKKNTVRERKNESEKEPREPKQNKEVKRKLIEKI